MLGVPSRPGNWGREQIRRGVPAIGDACFGSDFGVFAFDLLEEQITIDGEFEELQVIVVRVAFALFD